jgi:hypothetical protein
MADLQAVYTAQAQALKRAPLARKVIAGHASDNLDKRVDRRRSHSRRRTQCAHRDQAGRDVFCDEFVIERLRRSGLLIGPIAVVGEPLAGLDERRPTNT